MATTATVDPAALRELGATFRGELVAPAGPGYAVHRRVWNGSIDRHPALVARCADARDVTAAVNLARRTGLPLAVRGGGHAFPGASVVDGGVVVDLSLMKEIHVDPVARTARVQGGVLVGELDRATQTFGLGVTGGIVSHTGMAGLTLGGGLGWLMRTYGLTIDQLLSVDLVTADGRQVTADPNREPELFWGLRGGGGNFGVATAFTYRLHPVGPIVMAGPVFWSIADAPQVLRFYLQPHRRYRDGRRVRRRTRVGASVLDRPRATRHRRLRQLPDGRRPGAGAQAYGPQTLHRLRALKRRYDPDNRFHLNPNVDPDDNPGSNDKADAKPPKE